jgi:two-component system NtrC family sensor kinase
MMIEATDHNRRILVVDDNVAIHDDFRKILCAPKQRAAVDALESALFGRHHSATSDVIFEIESAYQGREAVDRVVAANAAGTPYALAFVDMRMPPGWDGLETVEQLWRVDAELQIVICSAYSDHTWNELHARLGPTDRMLILKKPFETIEVLQLAHALTAKWSLARQVRADVDALEAAVEARTEELNRQIRERDRVEEQLRQAQKMEAIGQLAGGVAHDFNNILTAILTNAENVTEQLGEGHALAYDVGEIAEAAQRGARLTRQLLTFSRKQVTSRKTVSLNVVVTELDSMLSRLVGGQITTSHALVAAIGLINADSGQLEQVLMNLVVNARDAMPDGGTIVIETQNVELDAGQGQDLAVPAGSYVRLAVSDTGCGMDAATRSKIFEPFFTTKELGKGTGLGLATVFGIVRQHEGAISVSSEVGRGSTFQIYFPRVDGGVGAAVHVPSARSTRGSESVLVVDDDAQVRKATCRLLSSRGYCSIETNSAAEALEILRRPDRVDLLLTDVMMPGMDGRVLATHARALRPGLRILFMSGYPQRVTTHIAAIEAEEHFVQKPFTALGLTGAIRRAVTPTDVSITTTRR